MAIAGRRKHVGSCVAHSVMVINYACNVKQDTSAHDTLMLDMVKSQKVPGQRVNTIEGHGPYSRLWKGERGIELHHIDPLGCAKVVRTGDGLKTHGVRYACHIKQTIDHILTKTTVKRRQPAYCPNHITPPCVWMSGAFNQTCWADSNPSRQSWKAVGKNREYVVTKCWASRLRSCRRSGATSGWRENRSARAVRAGNRGDAAAVRRRRCPSGGRTGARW